MARLKTRLSPLEIQLIRDSSLGPTALAEQLGVTRQAVSKVRQGRTYAGGALIAKTSMPSQVRRTAHGNISLESFDVPLKMAAHGRTIRERIAGWSTGPIGVLGCIEWSGGHEHGRPTMQIEQTGKFQVSRLVWMMHRGAIPKGKVIRHYVCNNGKCVNVDHFLLGTRKENNDDKVKDGTIPMGAASWNAKITEEIVRRVREPKVNLRAMAEELGFRYHTLYQARVGISWKHIVDPPPVTESMRQQGEDTPTAKLTAVSVNEIRNSTESISELSRRYGVSRPAIRSIQKRESWKSVPELH